MTIQLPLLLLPESFGPITGEVPLGDIHSFLILLAVAPCIVMLVILVLYQLRGSRIDDELGGDTPGIAAKPLAEAEPENPTRFMREAIEQLNGIAAALHNAIPEAGQAPGQEASSATGLPPPHGRDTASEEGIAGQLDTLDETASRTGPLPLTIETTHSVACDKAIVQLAAQLASKVRKLTELANGMQDERQALKRNAMEPQLASEDPAQSRHYLTFTLGDEQFAVSIQNIHGVVEAVQLVAEPSMPPKIRKAIRLQNALIPVIDLGARFGGQSIELGRGSRIVILEVPSGDRLQLIGVVVDAVGDVLELPVMEIEPPAASGSRIRDGFAVGTIRVDSRPVTLLDIGRGSSANELIVLRSAARPPKQENQPA